MPLDSIWVITLNDKPLYAFSKKEVAEKFVRTSAIVATRLDAVMVVKEMQLLTESP